MKKAAEGLPRNVRKTIRHQLYHKMKKKQGKSPSGLGPHFRLPVDQDLAFLCERFQERFKAVHNLNGQFTDRFLGENLMASAWHFKECV